MTPPEAPQVGTVATPGAQPPAVSSRFETLRKRSDFLRAARAAHTATPGFILQMRRHSEGEVANPLRVGFTCSKKVGNAVARNRAKRRLREIARLVLPSVATSAADFVLIGRKQATATLPFDQLQSDLRSAVHKLQNTRR